jgi:hypothetical protein
VARSRGGRHDRAAGRVGFSVNGRLAIVGLLLTAAVSAIFVGGELLPRSNEGTVVPPPTIMPDPSAVPSALPDTLVRHPAPLQPT